jgi:hypothetical protein
MGGKVSALDNAVFFGSHKRERLNRRSRATRREAQSALFEWIGCCYGPRRLNSTLGYLSSNNSNNRNRKSRKEGGSRLAVPVHRSGGGPG